MEEVILLGSSGTTKLSLTWSSGGNTFSFCLNKDFGGTLGRELNVDFFLAGLLEVGELLWHLYTLSTWVPRSVISLCSLSVWSAFSLKTLSLSKNFSNFVQFPSRFHAQNGRSSSLLVDGKSQHRWQLCGYILCSVERTPSNTLNFPYPDIIYQNLHCTLCKNYLHCIHYLQTSIFSPELSKHCSRNLPFLNLTALRAVLRITAPRAGVSNYVNKQIPLKTGLASYLVSKLHGSEVRNYRDQRVFFSHSSRSIFAANNRKKKNFLHPGYTISCYSRGLRSTKTLKESNRTPFFCNRQHTWLEIPVVMMEKLHPVLVHLNAWQV